MRTKYTKTWVKNRRSLVSSYKTWIRIRNVKLIFLYFFVRAFLIGAYAMTAEKVGDNPYYDLLQHKAMGLSGVVMLATVIILSICKEQQHEEQPYIDHTLLGRDTYNFAEFFPHTGIWVHRREAFLYGFRVRRFKRAIRKRVAFSMSLRQRRSKRFQEFKRRFLNQGDGSK